MDELIENRAWYKPRADVHFRLKESQPLRGLVSILVLNRRPRGLQFSFKQLKFKLARRLFQIQLVIRSYIQVLFFNQESIACYKIIILGLTARVFVF